MGYSHRPVHCCDLLVPTALLFWMCSTEMYWLRGAGVPEAPGLASTPLYKGL